MALFSTTHIKIKSHRASTVRHRRFKAICLSLSSPTSRMFSIASPVGPFSRSLAALFTCGLLLGRAGSKRYGGPGTRPFHQQRASHQTVLFLSLTPGQGLNSRDQNEGEGHEGSFRRERVGTPFPLLKCSRTHYGRHCKPFFGQDALDGSIFKYRPTISTFFWG